MQFLIRTTPEEASIEMLRAHKEWWLAYTARDYANAANHAATIQWCASILCKTTQEANCADLKAKDERRSSSRVSSA